MQGAKNIIVGILLMAAGIGLVMGLDLGKGMLYWAAWCLAGFGAILFAGGVYSLVGPGSKGVDAHEAYHTNSTARLLMQSMLATALNDGHLTDAEVKTIINACDEVVQQHLNPDSIRRLGDLVSQRGEALLEEIRAEGKMLNIDARRAIIDACVMVLKAEDQIDARQTETIVVIAEQLGFTAIEAEAMISEALAEDAG